ncbi:MAG: hypothetical protein K2X48_03830 [Chitinophagaceae bacterium]|nr:hypothetical protein [Chitinophagaceae bacterium]
MSIIKRLKAPTPSFFKKLCNIGIALAAVGGAIVTAPVILPAVIVSAGGYLAVAGAVIGAVSQVTVQKEDEK